MSQYRKSHKHSRSIGMSWLIRLVFAVLLIYYLYLKSKFHYLKKIYEPVIGGLNTYDLVLKSGEEYKLRVIALNKRVKFQSSDITVATVNINGKITAWKPGVTVITVKFDDKKLKCRVRVVDLNKSYVKLKKGESVNLKVKKAKGIVKYKSKNPSVAKVTKDGRIVGVKKGKTKIIASYKEKEMVCKVIVK